MSPSAEGDPAAAVDAYLDRLREESRALYRLAMVLSLAWRVEPLLLRNARRAFLPGTSNVLEARLWHSELVATRSASAIVIRRDLADRLVHRLARSPDYQSVRRFIRTHTRHWAVTDRLAQDMRVAALLGQRDVLVTRLNQALALVTAEPDPERRRDLARWARTALADWPQADEAPAALGWLAQFASAGVGDPLGRLAGPMSAAATLPDWLAERLPPPVIREGASAIGLRLAEGVLECVEPGVEDSETLPLPGPGPYPVLLQWRAGAAHRLRWESLWPGRRIDLGDPGCAQVALHPLQGVPYLLREEFEATVAGTRDDTAEGLVDGWLHASRLLASVAPKGTPVERIVEQTGSLPERLRMDVLSAQSRITCAHGGLVNLAGGRMPLTAKALLEATVKGCPNAGPGLRPCTRCVTIESGRAPMGEGDGNTFLLDTASGRTDGVPPGTIRFSVLEPVRVAVVASEIRVTRAEQRLRSGPGSAHPIILTLPPDTLLAVRERRGDWLRVTPVGGLYYVVAPYSHGGGSGIGSHLI